MSDLICRDCGIGFTFTDEKAAYFKSRGLSKPTHCPTCRKLSKVFVPENLDKSIRGSSVGCVCPTCGTVYSQFVELDHRLSDYSWITDGYVTVVCDYCRNHKPGVALLQVQQVKRGHDSVVNNRTVSWFNAVEHYSLSRAIDGYWEVDKLGPWSFSDCETIVPSVAVGSIGGSDTPSPLSSLPPRHLCSFPKCRVCHESCPTPDCFRQVVATGFSANYREVVKLGAWSFSERE